MPFIGNKPSAVPLTSADIADGIITSAKIVDGTIVNADINATSAITLNKLSGNPNFRNIVINGDMQIAQRNTSVASITTGGYRTLDRWYFDMSSLGTWTMSQSTDTPTGQGFASSLKVDCTTADATPAAGDYLQLIQIFEGQNLQYLKKGTASALSLTASFWVKSTKTGTFIAELVDRDNTRQISKSYTVNVTNTWEKKTITFEGDTTGALDNNNDASLSLNFRLGAGTDFTSGTLNTTWASTVNANRAVGQVNIADSTSNDWYITGVQLEAGTSATDFEFLPIDVNLGRCFRYFQKSYAYATAPGTNTQTGMVLQTGSAMASGYIGSDIKYPVEMRATPTVTSYTESGTSGSMNYALSGSSGTASTVNFVSSNKTQTLQLTTGSSFVVAQLTGHWTASAEL
jgi:hypothetical protein